MEAVSIGMFFKKEPELFKVNVDFRFWVKFWRQEREIWLLQPQRSRPSCFLRCYIRDWRNVLDVFQDAHYKQIKHATQAPVSDAMASLLFSLLSLMSTGSRAAGSSELPRISSTAGWNVTLMTEQAKRYHTLLFYPLFHHFNHSGKVSRSADTSADALSGLTERNSWWDLKGCIGSNGI